MELINSSMCEKILGIKIGTKLTFGEYVKIKAKQQEQKNFQKGKIEKYFLQEIQKLAQ